MAVFDSTTAGVEDEIRSLCYVLYTPYAENL